MRVLRHLVDTVPMDAELNGLARNSSPAHQILASEPPRDSLAAICSWLLDAHVVVQGVGRIGRVVVVVIDEGDRV